MSDALILEPASTLSLDVEKVRDFIETCLTHHGALLSLKDLSDQFKMLELSQLAARAFSSDMDRIAGLVSDARVGIAGLDIPVVYNNDATRDAISGALVAMSLSQHIMPSILDNHNNTPFTMFNASNESNEALNRAGLMNISPTDILDFHSDGSIENQILSVPDYIAIYNIFINYAKRGNFYWVPTLSMPSFHDHVQSIGYHQEYLFELTPAVYGDKSMDIRSIAARRAKTSIFRQRDNHIVTFMNGTFLGRDSNGVVVKTDLLKRFQSDISNNSFRYVIKQQSRRMLFLNNANGFHARDIFEEPLEGYSTTRSYLRSVSKSAQIVGEIVEI